METEQQPTPNPGLQNQAPVPTTPQPKKPLPKNPIIIAALLIFLIAAAALGYWEYKNNVLKPLSLEDNQGSPIVLLPSPKNNTTSPQSTDATSSTPLTITTTFNPNAETCKTKVPLLSSRSGMMQWLQPTPIANLTLFASASPDSSYQDDGSILLAHFISGKYAGGDLIVTDLEVQDDGPGSGPMYYYIVRQAGSYTVLDNYSQATLPDPTDIKPIVNLSEDKTFDLPDLDFPKTIHSNVPGVDLTLASNLAISYNGSSLCTDNLVRLFTDPVVGDVYVDPTTTTLSYNPNFGFYAEAPDGTEREYALLINFVGPDNVPQVIWSNGQKNSFEYSYTDRTGCGSYNFASVVPLDMISPSDLTQSGLTVNGSPIYEFKDPNNAFLKNFYNADYYPADGGDKIPYDQFVAAHPLFFWKDPFNRLIKLEKTDFMPLAECGKPVIYLYPQKTEKISVQVAPVGGMSKSDPPYNNGWNVISDPYSNITNLADGKIYSYLFWEGRGGLYQTPKQGFVASQADVHGLLEDKLSALGLNQKERSDFEGFWEPKMQSAPYYFVTFMGNSIMDQIAPLTINPKPDTIIRVLMDFTPLANPINVQGYNIHTPVRQGFTVVEWGGVLR